MVLMWVYGTISIILDVCHERFGQLGSSPTSPLAQALLLNRWCLAHNCTMAMSCPPPFVIRCFNKNTELSSLEEIPVILLCYWLPAPLYPFPSFSTAFSHPL